MKAALFTFLVLTPYVLWAQCNLTISGQVVASGDLHPVPFATVYEEESKKGELTDENGLFSLTNFCPGHIHLSISHVNHETLRFQLDITTDTTIVISLSENPNMLATITIIGEEEQENVGFAQTALSRSKLDKSSGRSISESLESITGVTSLKTGPGIAKPMIHGLYGNRIRMINNEIRQEGQQWGNEHAPEIDPFSADRLTVVKGAAVVRYGSGAISGAILVEPAELPQDHHLHGEVNFVGMSNGRLGVGAAKIEGGVKGLDILRWRIQGTVKAAGDFHTPDYFLTNTGIRESNFQVTVGTRSPRLITELFYSHFKTTIGILRGSHIGNLTDLDDAIGRDQPFFTNLNFSYDINNPKQKVVHDLFKAKILNYLGDHNYISFIYGFQRNNRQEFDVRRGGRSETPSLDMVLYSNSMDAIWHTDLNSLFTSEFGLRFTNQANNNNPDTGIKPLIPNYDSNVPGAFWIGKYRVSKSEFEVGFGYDYRNLLVKQLDSTNTVVRIPHKYHNYSTSLGVSVPFNNTIRYSGNIGAASRSPSVNELYSNGLHHGAAAIELGDTDLSVEKSIKTIHTLTISKSEKWGFELSGYYHGIEDFIYLKPEGKPRLTIRGAFPVYSYEQTDASLWGIDAGGRVNIATSLYYETSASTVHGYDRTSDKYLINMPADRWKNALSYLIPNIGALNDIEIKITGIQVWEQKRATVNAVDPNDSFGSLLEYNLAVYEDFLPPPGGYFLSEFETGFSLSNGAETIKFHFAVRNIFNISYRDYLNRMRYYADDTGRSFEFRINYSF